MKDPPAAGVTRMQGRGIWENNLGVTVALSGHPRNSQNRHP